MSILANQKGNRTYLAVSLLGKSLSLDIKYRSNPIIEFDKEDNRLILCLPKKYKTMKNIDIINMSIEKMYDEIAEVEIENAMEKIRLILGYAPEDYKIERMKDSFCKVKGKVVKVNPDIVKYSKKIIETTLVQAFCKTKYKTNSKAYEQALVNGMKKYEDFKYSIIRNKKVSNRIEKVS